MLETGHLACGYGNSRRKRGGVQFHDPDMLGWLKQSLLCSNKIEHIVEQREHPIKDAGRARGQLAHVLLLVRGRRRRICSRLPYTGVR